MINEFDYDEDEELAYPLWLKKYQAYSFDENSSSDSLGSYDGAAKTEFYKQYKTGSRYEGEWSKLGMDGHGKYIFPHGVIYEGKMKDGTFHGKGKLTYPRGQVIYGTFHNGVLVSWKFTFTRYNCDLGDYCKFPDRRYFKSMMEGLRPAPKERLTHHAAARDVPTGHYDVGDGFFNPKTKWIYLPSSFGGQNGTYSQRIAAVKFKPIDLNEVMSDGLNLIKKFPFVNIYMDEQFMTERCRRAWDSPTGYRPDLYETWLSGRKKEVELFEKEYEPSKEHSEKSNCLKLMDFFQYIIETENENE